MCVCVVVVAAAVWIELLSLASLASLASLVSLVSIVFQEPWAVVIHSTDTRINHVVDLFMTIVQCPLDSCGWLSP